MSEWRKERGLVWFILLYPDNESHMLALEEIKKSYSEYAYIKHQPEEGEKKEHIHVVVRFKNYRWNSALSEELGIEINMFEKARNLENALLYLVHARDSEKTQYDIMEVQGTLQKRLFRILQTDGKDNTDQATEIVDWIMEQSEVIKPSRLFYFASVNGLYGELVRGMKLFAMIIEEHNEEIRGLHNVHYAIFKFAIKIVL